MLKKQTKKMLALFMAVLMCFSSDALTVMATETVQTISTETEDAIIEETATIETETLTEETTTVETETSTEETTTVETKTSTEETTTVETETSTENTETVETEALTEETETVETETFSTEETITEETVIADENNPNYIPADFVDDSSEVLEQLMKQAEDIVEISAVTGSKKADVVFVIDNTGSMYDEISEVKTNLASFVNYLAEKGITLRFGIITYNDILSDGMDSTVVFTSGLSSSTWYTTASDTIAALDSIDVYGGGDIPETLIDGLGYLVDDKTYNWSSNATRCAIVLTDANYKLANRWGYDGILSDAMHEVALDLKERNIVTSVITDPYYYSTYQDLVDTTSGILGDINGNYLTILMEMADNILKYAAKTNIGVYVIPGYMGSQLYDKESGETAWVGMDTLVGDVTSYILGGLNENKYSTEALLGRDEN